MKHAIEPNGPAGLHAEGHDVLDLEVDHLANSDAVASPIVADVDCGSFHTEHLAHQRRERGHGSAELPGEDLNQSVELHIARVLVDKDTESPVSSVITFGVSAINPTFNPPIAVPSISPSRMLNTRVTRQKSYVAPWSNERLHGHISSHEQVST